MYDIIIAGAGPAGSTLARLIGKKYKVLVLEKRNFTSDDGKSKCCGGLIAPDAQLMLAKFGLGIPKSVILSPQLFAVRTLDFDNMIGRYYQRHYINIDRPEFDKWLFSIIPDEVDKIEGALFSSYEEKDDYITVKFVCNEQEYKEDARLLIGSDGAFSKIRRQGFSDCPMPTLYTSIQEWFETDSHMDYYGSIFDREITDFYSWTIPKENQLILGSALIPDENVNDKFELLKTKMKRYGFELNKSIKKHGAYIYRPTGSNQICLGNEKVALIGEAAGLISPSSAEGFSFAFESSLGLARALSVGLKGFHSVYKRNLKPLKRKILFKNIKSPAMYNKHLRNFVMRSGIMSIKPEKSIDQECANA